MAGKDLIIVTGASSGIGRATTTLLLENDFRVTGLARDFSKFPCDSPHFEAVEVDLSDLDSLPEQLATLTGHHPLVRGLVCCAGSGRFGSLEEFSYRQIRGLIELNLTSQVYIARALLPGMKQQRQGDIVFMGSEAALSGGRRGSVYSATKFGLRGLAQSLRQECAASGVRVSLINPGMVRTEFFDALDFGPGEDPDNYILPGDVAQAILDVIRARPGTVLDEINLSPQKKVIRLRQPED